MYLSLCRAEIFSFIFDSFVISHNREQEWNNRNAECLEINSLFKVLVFKETVVRRRWESETQKLGFIKRVDKG